MNPGSPTSRITFAIAFSVLLHFGALLLFQIELPSNETLLLPPLTAKLEAMPMQADTTLPELEPVNPLNENDRTETTIPKRELTPAPKTPTYEIATSEPVSIAVAEAASAVETTTEQALIPSIEAASAVTTTTEPALIPAIEATSAVANVEVSVPSQPLPKHAQLKFLVYLGKDNFQIGEINHRLEISGDKYILKAETQTTGLARLFKSYQLIQTSQGKVNNFGLQPENYEELQNLSGGNQTLNATFKWTENKIYFSHGGAIELPPNAQDILSFFYQLSQLSLQDKNILIAIATGKNLEKYELEIGAEEEVTTPMGKLRALPLRRLHSLGGDGMEVWLGLEYRLLPIKFRQIKRSGGLILEIVISDIRVADN